MTESAGPDEADAVADDAVADDAVLAPAPAKFDDGTCRNCGAELGVAFCGVCGQKRLRGRLHTGDLIRDAWTTFTDLDRGFLHTARGLTLQPGATVRQYVDGQRARHTPPARYYLIMLAAWLVTPALIGLDLHAATLEQMHGVWARMGVKGSDGAVAWVDWLITNRRLLNVGLLPLYAAVLALAFRKVPRTFAEDSAAVLFLWGHTYVIGIVGYLFMRVGLPEVQTLLGLFVLVYLAWAVADYTREVWWMVLLKGFAMYAGISLIGGCAGGWYALRQVLSVVAAEYSFR